MFLSLLHVNLGHDSDNPGRAWLRNLYRVHQRLWMAFPDAERRSEDPFFLGVWHGPTAPDPKPRRSETGFLFRIERDASPRILVQSAERPDWEYAFQNAPYLLAGGPQVREFDPAPLRDQAYRFRLLANVVTRKTVVHPDGKTRTTRAGLTIARRKRTEVLVHPAPAPDPLPLDPAERKRILTALWDPWRMWLDDMAATRGFRVERGTLLMEKVYTHVHNPDTGRDNSNRKKPIDWRYNGGIFEGELVCTDEEKLRTALANGIGPAKAFGFGLLSVTPIR